MKSFSEYFAINKPKYDFTVRLANCNFDSDMKKKMEAGLGAYVVENIGDVRRLPIREHAEFPSLGPCDVHVIQVSVKYPVVSDQLRQRIAESLGIGASTIFVRTVLEEQNFDPVDPPKKSADGSILNNPDLGGESGQHLVGDKRLGSMIKELETRKYTIAGQDNKGK